MGLFYVQTNKINLMLVFLNELNLPYVLIGRKNSNLNCDYVIADDKKGGFYCNRISYKQRS